MSTWLPWIKFACLLALPLVVLAAIDWLGSRGWFAARCPECRAVLAVTWKTLKEPTADEAGLAQRLRYCPQCGHREERQFVIDRYGGNFCAPPGVEPDEEEWREGTAHILTRYAGSPRKDREEHL